MTGANDGRLNSWLKSILLDADYKHADLFSYLVLLSAPVLLTVYRYFTEAQNFLCYFPSLGINPAGDVTSYLLEYLSFAILVLLIPVFLSCLFGRWSTFKPLFSLKTLKKHLPLTLLALALFIIPSAYRASSMPSVLAEYPLPRSLLQTKQLLPLYFFGLFFLYYLPWEFFFRGFLLFGLKEKFGTIPAILIQTIPSCLVHIGKPPAEILGSIPFGIIFGIIAVRTRNIWIVVLLHAALGIFTDLFIIY